MTYREKLEQEHPESINSIYAGGCAGCPCNYGYEAPVEKDCPTVTCTDCWDREMKQEKIRPLWIGYDAALSGHTKRD